MSEQLTFYYQLLGHAGIGFTELRYGHSSLDFNNFYYDLGAHPKIQIHDKLNMFMGINPRADRSKPGNIDNINYITCLVLDIDNPINIDYSIFPKNYVEVKSGSGIHIYIPIKAHPVAPELKETLTNSLREWTAYYRKIIVDRGMAKKVDHIFDLPRVMRLPGSINQKNGKMCTIDVSQKIERVDLKEILSVVGTPSQSPGATPVTPGEIDLSKYGELAEIIQRKDSFPSPSEAVFILVQAAIKYSLSREVILNLTKLVGTEGKDYSKDVDRIIEKQQEDTDLKSINLHWNIFKKSLNYRQTGFGTGLTTLDSFTGGLRRKEITIIGARPGSGKTSIIINFITEFLRQGLRVLIFPTEMGFMSLMDKLVAIETGIALTKFRDNVLTESDKDKISLYEKKFKESAFFVSEVSSPEIKDIENAVELIKPDILIVDFVQRCGFKNMENIPMELANFIRGIKNTVKKHNCVGIVASQLNRIGTEDNPQLATLKGSGGLEEEGDLILLIACENKNKNPRPISLRVEKNKYGELAFIPLIFEVNYGKIYEQRT